MGNLGSMIDTRNEYFQTIVYTRISGLYYRRNLQEPGRMNNACSSKANTETQGKT
jgi:hypothetical protein